MAKIRIYIGMDEHNKVRYYRDFTILSEIPEINDWSNELNGFIENIEELEKDCEQGTYEAAEYNIYRISGHDNNVADDDEPIYCEAFVAVKDEPKEMTRDEARHLAEGFYGGGWRAEDRDDIADEYDLNEREANWVCERLEEIAQEESDRRLELLAVYMDDDIRESVHMDLAPCTNEEFLEEYKRRHFEKYGEEFEIN